MNDWDVTIDCEVGALRAACDGLEFDGLARIHRGHLVIVARARVRRIARLGRPCSLVRPTTIVGSARERDHPAVRIERRLATEALELGARDLVASVVAGADHRRGFDVLEPELECLDLHLGELVGMVVAHEGQVVRRRAQVDRKSTRLNSSH